MGKYRAFLSYARADSAIADRIFRLLDRYRTPNKLVGVEGRFGPAPAKLHPVFRDKEDLSGGGALPSELRAALSESDALVVICTPVSATRPWVEAEVQEFKTLGRADRIFPILADSPDDPISHPLEAYLPPSLRDQQLIAVDLRAKPGKRWRWNDTEQDRFKLLAGLLGLPLDALLQRERARQRVLQFVYAGLALVFAGLTITAGALGFQAERERARAVQGIGLIMAERGWQAIERGQHLRAARYALLGLRAAPSESERFRQILARVRQDANESIRLVAGRHGILNSFPSPEGDIVVAAHRFGGATVFEAASGAHLFEMSGHRHEIEEVAFEPSRIITRLRTGVIQAWDRTTGALLATEQGEPPLPARTVFREGETREVASSSTFLVRHSNAQGLTVVRRETGETVFSEPSLGPLAAISDLSQRLVVISGAVHVLDTSDFHQVRSLALPENSGPWHLTMSPDGAEVVIYVARESYSDAGTTPPYVISTVDGNVVGALLGHTQDVHSVAYSQGGSTFITTSKDGTTRVWRSPLGRLTMTRPAARDTATYPQRALTHTSPDGRYTISERRVGGGQALFLTDNTTSESHVLVGERTLRRDGELGHLEPWLDFVAFTPNSQGVVVSTPYRGGAIWSLAERRPIVSLTVDSNETAQIDSAGFSDHNAAFSADGAQLVTAGDRARLWDAATGELLHEFGSASRATTVDITRDGRRVVVGWGGDVGGRGGEVNVYDVDGDQQIILPGHAVVVSVAFAPSQSHVVVIDAENVLWLWDYTTGNLLAIQRVSATLERSIGFPDSALVEVLSANGAAFSWNIAAANMPLNELVSFACETLLRGDNRRFSDEELHSDPLINVIIPRQGAVRDDLCV